MATINLGSIKFNWKGAYSAATSYVIDDVVSYQGASYICKLASTGNVPTNTTYFDVMSSAGVDGTDLTSTLTTQGDLVYRDGSGLARLGAGTSGQVLTTGGAGANPTWSTVSSDWVRLGSTSGSGVATISFDLFTTDYDIYKVFVNGWYGTSSGQGTYMRLNSSAGTEDTGSAYRYIFSGGYYNSSANVGNQNTGGWNNNAFGLSNISQTSGEIGNHEITVFQPGNSSIRTSVIVTGGGFESNHIYSRNGQGVYDVAKAHTGLTFYANLGTSTISNIEVYGIK